MGKWKAKGYNTIYEAVQGNTGRADEFLNDKDSSLYHIQNLDVLANWIYGYIQAGMKFYIVGDYDCDGVMATAGLKILLQSFGAANVVTRLPRRMSEGYGMSEKIVDEFPEPGVIITVDNGIKAFQAVKKAKERGFIVLVTDHHQPDIRENNLYLPAADLIVDPHVPNDAIALGSVLENSFNGYCGAGLVYKLAQMMLGDCEILDIIASMAAIATVADVVPLIEDNRNIYKHGIMAIKERHVTVGLQRIIDELNSDNVVNESDIGFKIGPMINAPGRIYDDGAERALNAVLSSDTDEAEGHVYMLDTANETRKQLKAEAVNRAISIMEDECLYGMNPIVIVDKETPEGIIGLVAGELCERYNASAIVFTGCGKNGLLKGSCRGASYNNIIESLNAVNDANPDWILGYGGHKGAAGLTIREDIVSKFTDAIQDVMGEAVQASDEVEYDIEIPAGELPSAVEETRRFAPFGEGNPQLIFRIDGLRLVPNGNSFYKLMGNNDSIRFYGAGCEAVGFGLAKKYEELRMPKNMDMVGILSYHSYGGKTIPQIELKDFNAVETKPVETKLGNSIMEAIKLNGLFSA